MPQPTTSALGCAPPREGPAAGAGTPRPPTVRAADDVEDERCEAAAPAAHAPLIIFPIFPAESLLLGEGTVNDLLQRRWMLVGTTTTVLRFAAR